MLSNNNHNHQSCAVSEQIISYLYGETNPSERAALKAHLQDCSTCADEFADFGTIRSAVQEWRNVEFKNLETPRFEIQTDYLNQPIAPSNYQTWQVKLRDFFTRPVLATAAFALLVLIAGATLLTQNFRQTDELAKETDNQNSIKAVVSPTSANMTQSLNQNSGGKDSEKSPSEQISIPILKKPENTPSRNARDEQKQTKDSAVKISDNAAKNSSDSSEFNRSVKATNKTIKKSPNVQKPSVPLYSIQTDDDEDKSVRLADLFDEIDSK